MKRFLFIIIACALLAACGSKQQRADEQPTEAATADAADLDEVDAADLADSPCGNPDWSRLPEGSDAPDSSSN